MARARTELKHVVLEEAKALRESGLWKLQRRYYERVAVRAWTDSVVPNFVTSNAFIARSYARTLLAFAQDRWDEAKRNGMDLARETPGPVYVLEVGSGHGKLCFHVIHELLGLRAHWPAVRAGIASDDHFSGFPVVWVMTDFSERTVAFLQAHPYLKSVLSHGVAQTGVFDAESDGAFRLELLPSGNVLDAAFLARQRASVAVVCNYVLDTLRQDAFLARDGKLWRANLSIHSLPSHDIIRAALQKKTAAMEGKDMGGGGEDGDGGGGDRDVESKGGGGDEGLLDLMLEIEEKEFGGAGVDFGKLINGLELQWEYEEVEEGKEEEEFGGKIGGIIAQWYREFSRTNSLPTPIASATMTMSVPLPITAFQVLNRVANLVGDDGAMLFFAGDKAYSSPMELFQPAHHDPTKPSPLHAPPSSIHSHPSEPLRLFDPHVAKHGSFSLMANFHAVMLWALGARDARFPPPTLPPHDTTKTPPILLTSNSEGFKCLAIVTNGRSFPRAESPATRVPYSLGLRLSWRRWSGGMGGIGSPSKFAPPAWSSQYPPLPSYTSGRAMEKVTKAIAATKKHRVASSSGGGDGGSGEEDEGEGVVGVKKLREDDPEGVLLGNVPEGGVAWVMTPDDIGVVRHLAGSLGFGPDSFSGLQRVIRDKVHTAPVTLALKTLLLSHWDADVFFKFRSELIDKGPYLTQAKTQDLAEAARRVVLHHFPLSAAKDVPFEAGRVMMGIRRYDEAVMMFFESQRLWGEHYVSWYNIGICHHFGLDHDSARAAFERALELKPGYSLAVEWNDLNAQRAAEDAGEVVRRLRVAVTEKRRFDPFLVPTDYVDFYTKRPEPVEYDKGDVVEGGGEEEVEEEEEEGGEGGGEEGEKELAFMPSAIPFERWPDAGKVNKDDMEHESGGGEGGSSGVEVGEEERGWEGLDWDRKEDSAGDEDSEIWGVGANDEHRGPMVTVCVFVPALGDGSEFQGTPLEYHRLHATELGWEGEEGWPCGPVARMGKDEHDMLHQPTKPSSTPIPPLPTSPQSKKPSLLLSSSFSLHRPGWRPVHVRCPAGASIRSVVRVALRTERRRRRRIWALRRRMVTKDVREQQAAIVTDSPDFEEPLEGDGDFDEMLSEEMDGVLKELSMFEDIPVTAIPMLRQLMKEEAQDAEELKRLAKSYDVGVVEYEKWVDATAPLHHTAVHVDATHPVVSAAGAKSAERALSSPTPRVVDPLPVAPGLIPLAIDAAVHGAEASPTYAAITEAYCGGTIRLVVIPQ